MPNLTLVPDDLGPDPASWSVERRAPCDLTEAELAAWRALARRGLEPSVLADPDFVLPAAQHLAGPREAFLLLAWETPAGRAPTLRGVLPMLRPTGLLAGLASPRRPLALRSAPLVDAARAEAALGALLADLTTGSRALRHLDLADVVPGGRLDAALRGAARRLGLPVGTPPSLRVPASDAAADGAEVALMREPSAVREGVEAFLALEAGLARGGRSGRACLLDDPAGATAFRVVARRFARRRLCRVALARHGGALVGAAVSLRLGGREIVWRRAGAITEGGAGPGEGMRVRLAPEAALSRVGRAALRLGGWAA